MLSLSCNRNNLVFFFFFFFFVFFPGPIFGVHEESMGIALFPGFSTFSVLRFLLNNTQKWKNGTKEKKKKTEREKGKAWEVEVGTSIT